MMNIRHLIPAIALSLSSLAAEELDVDLLVVGGTESGCAAAVQAARMGVTRIALVNDIEWLGGQFSAEGLGAIDENRGHGYDGTVPIPRSGIFREVIDAIETRNAELYNGVKRPGNTRVITTGRPVVSEQVFRELLAPYEKSGVLTRFSNFRPDEVITESDRVTRVIFSSTTTKETLTVRARLTIDASDWGDIIRLSGAEWDYGIDSREEYGEPSAPESMEPVTDINPITWCLILEQQESPSLFPEPSGYDPRYFNGKWGWIDEKFAYTTRRLVDNQGFSQIEHPDILLINTPPIDYPLDVYPASLAAALEDTEPGASRKPLPTMSPEQRALVFADAKNHSLKFYYHLQSQFPKFRNMALSEEFGTPDKLPPKPYIRESLRLVSQKMIREQDVTGFESRSNYANEMFPDAVFSWQFEMDFHPTRRSWRTEQGADGPWEADFRGNRRFGRGGTGRSVFPLRALTPVKIRGLLGAQKNLGYTSIVGSSCRLHDQSIHAGQASGAVTAVSLRGDTPPESMWNDREKMAEVWEGLLAPADDGAPLVIWPFADLDPYDPDFAAIQQLALRRLFPMEASDTSFDPEQNPTPEWVAGISASLEESGYELECPKGKTRREVARKLWRQLESHPLPDDFFITKRRWKPNPARDGIPDGFPNGFRYINFAGSPVPDAKQTDQGMLYSPDRGYGWSRDISENHRLRNKHGETRSGFVFTRTTDSWQCDVDNGTWKVVACFGDAGHDQPDQRVKIEDSPPLDFSTGAGQFNEVSAIIEVADGQLTLELGRAEGGSNTCINWVLLAPENP